MKMAPSYSSQPQVISRSPGSWHGARLQRKCACGGTPGPTGECESCKKKRLAGFPLQPKLSVSNPGDAYEREADHAADALVGGKTQPALSPVSRGVQPNEHESNAVPEIVGEVLAASGQPLDRSTLGTMTRQFGYDFGRVRVHTDAPAAASAQAVSAHAYTVGEHIVFDAGRYAPGTNSGRHLLAHELAHVVQQSAGASQSVQRQDKPEERTDVALVFGDEADAMTEGRSYAPTALRVTSGTDAKAQLMALNKPIGRIFVVSHSNSAGQVQVISKIGTTSMQKLSDLSADLKGMPADKAPTDIDFRGCRLGNAPGEMETFRKNVGAKTARGMTCWSIVQVVTPLMLPGQVPLTDVSQIPAGKEREVDAALVKQINALKSDDGHAVKNCIEGLAAGETADANLVKIKKLYFQHKGNLAAVWASPEYNHDWQKESLCVKDLTEKTSPCAITNVKAPAPPPPPAAGPAPKQGMTEEEPLDTRLAGDKVATQEGEQVA